MTNPTHHQLLLLADFFTLGGVPFHILDWYAITERKLTLQNFFKLPIEERRAALKYLGLQYFVDSKQFVLFDRSPRGNTLYYSHIFEGRRGFAINFFLLSYKCSSTHKTYLSPVNFNQTLEIVSDHISHHRVPPEPRYQIENMINGIETSLLLRHAVRHHIVDKKDPFEYLTRHNFVGYTADAAMAWKLNLTLAQYKTLTEEA
jgi:hypothetical protein